MARGDTLSLEIRARRPQELFSQAICAVTDCMTPSDRILPREARWLEVVADDESALLAGWIREVLTVFDTEGTLFSRAETELSPGEDGRLTLRGHLWGEPRDPERHPLQARIEPTGQPRVWFDGESWRAALELRVETGAS